MIPYFYAVFIATIIGTRVFLYVRPTSSPKIKGFQTHHYMHGLVGIVIGLMLKYAIVFSIGLGLFIDELTAFVLMRGKTHEDNYSKLSLFGTFVFSLIVFFYQEHLIEFYKNF